MPRRRSGCDARTGCVTRAAEKLRVWHRGKASSAGWVRLALRKATGKQWLERAIPLSPRRPLARVLASLCPPLYGGLQVEPGRARLRQLLHKSKRREIPRRFAPRNDG